MAGAVFRIRVLVPPSIAWCCFGIDMINWKVRLKSPAFWTGLIGVLGAFAVGMAQLFGVDITAEAGSWQQALTALVTAVFGVLALVGVTTDPTTKGLGDSAQALTYHKPKDDREG